MNRLGARTNYLKLNEATKAVKRKRLVKEAKNRQKERAAKFPEGKIWSKRQEKRAKVIRSAKGVLEVAMPVDSPEKYEAAVIKRRSVRKKANDEDGVFGYHSVLSADTPAKRQNIMEAALRVTGKKKYKVTTSLFHVAYEALGFSASGASKRAAIANYALARGVTPQKLPQFIEDLGGIEDGATAARAAQMYFDGRVMVSVAVTNGSRCSTLFFYMNDEHVEIAWEAFKGLPEDKREQGLAVDKAIVEAVMKSHARAKAKAAKLKANKV